MTATYRILIVGGCYAGLAAATNLLDLSEGRPPRFSPTDPEPSTKYSIEVTVVDERDGYYHVIGSPLALASTSFAERAWTRFVDVPGLQHPKFNMIHGSVTKVAVESKTATIRLHESEDTIEKSYDYLIAASGLRRSWPVVPQSLTRDTYLTEAGDHIAAVKTAKQGVVVIGGGAVGIEMAAELKFVHPQLKVTLVHSRDRLLSSEPLPEDFKDETLTVLKSVGVEVLTNKRVKDMSKSDTTDGTMTLTLSDGTELTTSHVINAISHSVSTSTYLPSSVLDSEGYVKIQPTLHFLQSSGNSSEQPQSYDPYHFAAGDIAAWSGIRRCGAAMHMGNYAAQNIHAQITSTLSSSSNPIKPEYKSLYEHKPMIGLALGSTGIAYSPTEGIKSGSEVLKYMFQDDLGFGICYNYMKLGENPALSTEGNGAVAPTATAKVSSSDVPTTDRSESQTDNINSNDMSSSSDSDQLTTSTSDLTLEEWIAKAKSTHVRTKSTSSNPTLDALLDHQVQSQTQQPKINTTSSTSPSLSAASSQSTSDSIIEPQTPFDAVGNANVTNFEALESPELKSKIDLRRDIDASETVPHAFSTKVDDIIVEETIEEVRCDVDVPVTKVSPIRVAEGPAV